MATNKSRAVARERRHTSPKIALDAEILGHRFDNPIAISNRGKMLVEAAGANPRRRSRSEGVMPVDDEVGIQRLADTDDGGARQLDVYPALAGALDLGQCTGSDAAVNGRVLLLVLIDVNHRNGKKRNDAVNDRYGNPMAQGLPVLVVLDGDGKQLTTQETGALEDGKSAHDPAKVIAFLQKWAPKK